MVERRIARELLSVARNVLAIDFSHNRLVRQMWRDKVVEAKERQGIFFDLENDDSIGDPQVVKVGEYDSPTGPGTSEMVPYRFIVQPCKAGGDWENPVLYYRVQVHPKSRKPSVKLFKFDEDNTFVYIPVDGNSNLRDAERENEDGAKYTVLAPTNNGDDEGVDVDDKACEEDLLAFLEKMVALKLDPEAGWEDEPVMEFKGGRLVTSSLKVEIIKREIDKRNTEILRARKSLKSRSRGAIGDSIEMAGYYARKHDKPYFAYLGNSYGNSVWRVGDKNEAMNVINNMGDVMYIVSPDLEITKLTIRRQENLSSAGLVTASEYPTFMELHEQAAKTGDHHHLRLHCVKCGKVETCRCSASKQDFYGICYDCFHGGNT